MNVTHNLDTIRLSNEELCDILYHAIRAKTGRTMDSIAAVRSAEIVTLGLGTRQHVELTITLQQSNRT